MLRRSHFEWLVSSNCLKCQFSAALSVPQRHTRTTCPNLVDEVEPCHNRKSSNKAPAVGWKMALVAQITRVLETER